MQVALRFPGRLLAGLLFVLLAGRIAAQAPVITLNPVSQTNTVGSLASFTVEATGTLPLTYDYYFNGFKISSFTNGIISFPVSSVLEAGTYLAVVTNALGSATSAPATLTVLGPPVFSVLPQPQTVFIGQTATFSAVVLSAVPVTYQWLFQNNAIQDATNATLVLPNVVTNQIGFYAVQARNEYGTRTSLASLLTVDPLPAASVRLGVLTSTNRIRVPVLFTAHSTETNIGFSVSFDPTVFTNATFVPERDILVEDPEDVAAVPSPSIRIRPAALPNDAIVTTDESQLAAGRLGLSIAWATNNLAPGESSIGLMLFDLVDGMTNALAGQLGVTNLPVPAVYAPALDGATNIILKVMNPQLVAVGGFSLNRQTGLQQHVVTFGNPGNAFLENTRLTVAGLGFDSLTNAIFLANAQGILLLSVLPYVDLGAIAPTEVRQALLEYYVTDRVTVPTPTFNLFATPPFVLPTPNGSVLTNVVTRWTNGLVLVEFPTVSLNRYYIQYASTLAGFTNGSFSTSLPPMYGTGSRRQWLDSGPPRTAAVPVDESRFYRVLEVK